MMGGGVVSIIYLKWDVNMVYTIMIRHDMEGGKEGQV